MFFLVDFENVRSIGLDGTEFLTNKDTLIIFFSDASKNIKRCRLDEIKKSGCNWEIIKLKSTGKNAMDYYIATSVGEIMALNPDATIAIISSDKGFHAVKEYWRERLKYAGQLVQAASVFIGMCNGRDDTGRRRVLQYKNDMLPLEREYAKYQERRRIIELIEENFKGSIYESKIPEIETIINGASTPKDKYLASLKTFGRKDGMDIYRKIKLVSFNCSSIKADTAI